MDVVIWVNDVFIVGDVEYLALSRIRFLSHFLFQSCNRSKSYCSALASLLSTIVLWASWRKSHSGWHPEGNLCRPERLGVRGHCPGVPWSPLVLFLTPDLPISLSVSALLVMFSSRSWCYFGSCNGPVLRGIFLVFVVDVLCKVLDARDELCFARSSF